MVTPETGVGLCAGRKPVPDFEPGQYWNTKFTKYSRDHEEPTGEGLDALRALRRSFVVFGREKSPGSKRRGG